MGRHNLSYSKEKQGGGAMTDLYVGIDVSKDCSSAHGIDVKGRSNFSLSFSMDAEGFAELWKEIMGYCKDFSKVMVGVESTACYHMNLYSFLTAKGINTVVINPLLIANFAKLSLRKPSPEESHLANDGECDPAQ